MTEPSEMELDAQSPNSYHNHHVKVEEIDFSIDTHHSEVNVANPTQSDRNDTSNEPASAKRSHSKKTGGSRARAKSTSRTKPSSGKSKSRHKKSSQSNSNTSTRNQTVELEQSGSSDDDDDNDEEMDEEEYIGRPANLSAREMEQEKQALAYRLLLKRPEFLARRRQQQADTRSQVDTQVTRWPYIDTRNVDLWNSEQYARKSSSSPSQSSSSLTQTACDSVQSHSEVSRNVSSTSNGVSLSSRDSARRDVADLSKSDDTVSDELGVPVSASSTAADGELTESDDDAPITSARAHLPPPSRPSVISRIPRVDDKHRKARQALIQQTSSQCPAYPDDVFSSQPEDPFGLVSVESNLTRPELTIGTRCHIFDKVTNRHRDGHIAAFTRTRGYQIRLDPIASDSTSRAKDSSLQRWIQLHEEPSFWEVTDVAWSRNPDLKSKQKFWPCQVVQLYKFGVRSYSIADNNSNQRTAPDYVLVHLLGYFEDYDLHEIPTRLVFPFLHGLQHSWGTRSQHKAVHSALEVARWLYHFHCSRWLKLENDRRRAVSHKLCSLFQREGPGPFVGKRVSCLWKEDSMWYAGVITQFNALTQSFSVVYDDREMEWISFARNVFTLDSFALPVTVDLDEDQPYPHVDVCYFDFRLYADNPPSVSDPRAWLKRMDAIRKYQADTAYSQSHAPVPAVMSDPAIGQQGQECWECGLVDDVFLLSAMRGVEKNRSDNISCLRCSKICHPRCYALMRDRLEHGKHNDNAHADDHMLDVEVGNHRRADADEGGQRWTIIIDKSKPPRCVDCLKCEHCHLFGAKATRPQIVEVATSSDPADPSADVDGCSSPPSESSQQIQSNPPKEVYATLRAPTDLLTCDVCNIRVHRQCLEPPFSEAIPKLVGGWVCRACLACRSCLTTQAQFEHALANPGVVASSSISRLFARDHLTEEVDSADESVKTREKADSVTHKKRGGNRRGKKTESQANDPLASILQALEDDDDDVEDDEHPASESMSATGELAEVDRSCMSTPPAGQIPADIIGQLVRDVLTNIICNITDPVSHDNDESAKMSDQSQLQHSAIEPKTNPIQFVDQSKQISFQSDVPQSSLNTLASVTSPSKPQASTLPFSPPSKSQNTTTLSPLPNEPVLLLGTESRFWELWKHEFTMCNGCTDRMTAREYCVICCALWDDLPMVQCARCVRWIHIECDKNARSTDDETLAKDSVVYHCPDCVSRERANEMIDILDVLNTQDRNHYFLNPVTAEDAPEYTDTIKTPMDFTTIYNKLYSMSYKTIEQFKYDLNLVWRNAKDYNPSSSIVYKTAVRLQQKSVELLDILRIKNGDAELEYSEGRIEDKEPDREHSSNHPSPSATSSSARATVPNTSLPAVPESPPEIPINIDQRQREQLMINAIQPFRFFHPPDSVGELLMHIDICTVCGAAGDHEHFLACSDCGDMFHWFCLDIDMLRRAYRDPSQTGGPQVAVEDFDSINHERLTGHWKCHNCTVCNICSTSTRLRTLETKQVQRRNDRDREREEFGEEQTTSYTVQVVSETVVQQPIVDCDICDRTFHIKCIGPKFELPPSPGPDYPPPPYRCVQCVYCLFCGTTRPGKKPSDEWQMGYTACSPCARLWREGKCCPVCQKLWRKEGSSTSSTNHSIKSELDHSMNGHDDANEEDDSMQCEKCRKWTHLTCDPLISQAQYELLGNTSFEYFCPTCRAASYELDQEFGEQLDALRDLQDQMQRKQRLAVERMITKQDISSVLYAPFPKGVDALARFAPDPRSNHASSDHMATNIINTIFNETADVGMLDRLNKLSQRQIMEQTKKFVHRAQTLRRRERRKWLVQQKRASRKSLPLAQRCAPWLVDTNESSSADHDTLALIDKLLKELLIVYNRHPTQSHFLLPRILAVMDPYEPRPVSPGPLIQLPQSHISMESQSDRLSSERSLHQHSSRQPPKLEAALPNGVKTEGPVVSANGVSSQHNNGAQDTHIFQRHEHSSTNHMSQSHSTSSTIKHEPGMLIPVPPRNRHIASPLSVSSFTFTFEGQQATDPRVCFLCNKHGDQEEHLDSSGRLLPADPFKPGFSYVHIHCALWASSMHGSTSEQGEMTGVFTAYVKHCRQQCDHCGEFVASIGCRFSKCKKFFHFDCAIAADCIFTADTKVYCAEHASRTKGLIEHNLVPVQRAMFIRTSAYDVTDGKLKMKPSTELRIGFLTSSDGRPKTKVHYKRRKAKTSTWHEKRGIKKQKVGSPEHSAPTEDPTPEIELEEGEIDPRTCLEEGEIDPDDDDDAESKSEHAESVTVKNEIENTSSPSLEHPANQITVSPTLYHQRLGALTIISLGSVNPSPGFHSSHFMYPIGFHAYRLFWSYVTKYRRVGYHLYIESQNDHPLFRIVADDDTDHPIESTEPAAAFTMLVKRLRAKFGSSYRTTSPMISAPWLFGYGLPPVVEQLEYREGSDMLSLPEYEFGYNSRRMEVRKSDLADIETERLMHLADERAIQAAMAVEVPINPTGCARLEPYAGKRPWSSKVNYKAGFGFNSALLTGAGPAAVSFSSSNLAATVELASDKRRKVGQVEASATHMSANAMSAAALTHAYRAMKNSVTPRAVVGHSVIHEWGLFAACHLEANTMVVEYLGESIRQKVADMREKRYEETGIGSCYMFRIDSDMIIDATKRGNIGRFINHSCDPNCVTRIIDVNGVKKIAVITNRRVNLADEITYDYFFANEADRIACNCGARNCAGRLN